MASKLYIPKIYADQITTPSQASRVHSILHLGKHHIQLRLLPSAGALKWMPISHLPSSLIRESSTRRLMRMPPSHPTPSPLPVAHPFPPQTHHYHHHQKYTLQFADSGVGQTDVTFQSESRDLASDLLALPHCC